MPSTALPHTATCCTCSASPSTREWHSLRLKGAASLLYLFSKPNYSRMIVCRMLRSSMGAPSQPCSLTLQDSGPHPICIPTLHPGSLLYCHQTLAPSDLVCAPCRRQGPAAAVLRALVRAHAHGAVWAHRAAHAAAGADGKGAHPHARRQQRPEHGGHPAGAGPGRGLPAALLPDRLLDVQTSLAMLKCYCLQQHAASSEHQAIYR